MWNPHFRNLGSAPQQFHTCQRTKQTCQRTSHDACECTGSIFSTVLRYSNTVSCIEFDVCFPGQIDIVILWKALGQHSHHLEAHALSNSVSNYPLTCYHRYGPYLNDF